MSRLTPEILAIVERTVQGTCQSLMVNFDQASEYYEWGFDFDDLTAAEEEELCEYIDNLHFECSECGWWCEAGDYNIAACEATGENICSQCGSDYNE